MKRATARAARAPVRILVADDHAIVRRGLRALLEAERGWTVTAEAKSGREAVLAAARTLPDVAILDVVMPDKGGLEIAAAIRRVSPGTRLLVLTMYDSEEILGRALAQDVGGFVLKSAASRDVVAAVRAILRGQRYVSPAVEKPMSELVAVPAADRPSLTSRERQVLRLVAEGSSTKEVASALGISTKTADAHRTNLMRKLGIHSVARLVRYAVRSGIAAP